MYKRMPSFALGRETIKYVLCFTDENVMDIRIIAHECARDPEGTNETLIRNRACSEQEREGGVRRLKQAAKPWGTVVDPFATQTG